MTHYDVAVVGAGPGGSTAAYHLARSGLRTLLLEKERMPRDKPCGGGLTFKVGRLLDADFQSVVEQEITAASVAFGQDRVQLDFGRPVAWSVSRDRFDLLLAERAAGAGAEFRDGVPVKRIAIEAQGVTVSTGREEIRAGYLVGADGANGIVRRMAGFPPHRRMGAAIEAELDAPPSALDAWRGVLHMRLGSIPWGYGWIFPKAGHLSVGAGALVRPGRPLNLRAELARYLEEESSLRGSVERLTRGHRLPLGGEAARCHAQRTLLVGDAAGLVDPFTAEGIYFAMRSGQIAAEEIARAAGSGESRLDAYTRRIDQEINSDFRFAWLLMQVVYRLPGLCYSIFKTSSRSQATVAALVNGQIGYRHSFWSWLRGPSRSPTSPS